MNSKWKKRGDIVCVVLRLFQFVCYLFEIGDLQQQHRSASGDGFFQRTGSENYFISKSSVWHAKIWQLTNAKEEVSPTFHQLFLKKQLKLHFCKLSF